MFSIVKSILGALGILVTAGGGLVANGTLDSPKQGYSIWETLELVKKIKDVDDYLNKENFSNKRELEWHKRHETIRKNICEKWRREKVFTPEDIAIVCN